MFNMPQNLFEISVKDHGLTKKAKFPYNPSVDFIQNFKDASKDFNDLFLKIKTLETNFGSNIDIKELKCLAINFDQFLSHINKKYEKDFKSNSGEISDGNESFIANIVSIKKKFSKAFIIGNISNIDELYNQILTILTKIKNEIDLNKINQNNIQHLLDDIKKIMEAFNQINKTLKYINEIDDNPEIFSKEIISKEYTCRLIVDGICSYIFSISKPGVSFDVNNIIFSFNIISKIFEPNGNQLINTKSYCDFLDLFYSENPKFQRPNKSVNETFIEVLKLIEKENGLHFYVTVLFRNFIDNIINPNNSTLDIFTKFKETFESNYHQYLFYSNSFWSEYDIFVDNNIHFYMERKAKGNIDQNPLPLYPMGNLLNLLHYQKYNFSVADKITIIEQIATKLQNFHDLKNYIKFLSSDIIFLNSNLDVFIVPHQSSHMDTVLANKEYYRAPETFSEQNYNEDELGNIYSFGVLMFEIIIEKELRLLMKEESTNIKTILKTEYFECLKSKVIINETENYYLYKQFEEIIEKCMKVNKKDRYKSMKDIIKDIKALEIYNQNEKEIKYRISHSINNCSDKCELSDVLVSYCKGNRYFDELIFQLLFVYHSKLFTEDKLPITKDSNPITNIIKMFKVKKHDTRLIWMNLFNCKIDHNVMYSLRLISEYLELNNISSTLIQSYSEFAKIFNHKTPRKLIEELQNGKKYYCIIDLFHIVIKNYLDNNELFVSKVQKLLESYLRDNCMIEICDANIFNGPNSSHKLCINNECQFYLKINYNSNVRDEKKVNEKQILSNYQSKHVVYMTEDIISDSVIIPYFPFGTLKNLIENIQLRMADKFVIALEIAKGINDLHNNNNYHGHLDIQCIFISAKKNAYIASFCHDKLVELNASKPDFPCSFLKLEGKMKDIWSFGYLLCELFTNKTSLSQLTNKTRSEETKIINDNDISYLFSEKLNEYDDYHKKIINDIKLISQKCIKNSYNSMNEVIGAINEVLMSSTDNETRDEVNYRILNCTDSKEYECTLSDIVLCYYQKNGKSLDDINKLLYFLKSNFFGIKTDVDVQGDLIKFLYKFFDAINPELILKNVFRNCYQKGIKSKIDHSNNKLLAKIKDKIRRYPEVKDFCPNFYEKDKTISNESVILIGTLDEYIKNNVTNLPIELIYYIILEMKAIHSLGLYHGELKMNTIAIYYDIKEKKIVSSIIYFYSFYKLENKKLVWQKKSSNYSNENMVSEYQRIDIKRFNSIIIEALSEYKIPSDLIEDIKTQMNSMDYIYNALSKFFANNSNWNNI